MISLIVFCLFVILVIRWVAILKRPFPPIAHWHHHFDNFSYSSQEFYTAITLEIYQKEIPGVSIAKLMHAEGGVFSMSREYLLVTRRNVVFEICAAPFAKDFFVSWWQEIKPGTRDILIRMFPFLARTRFAYRREQTFFERDTEIIFKEAVHACVLKVVDELTTTKGLRCVPHELRQIHNQSYL